MRFSIKYKLLLAILATICLVVICIHLFGQWSFDRGFLRYVNTIEQTRLEGDLGRLEERCREDLGIELAQLTSGEDAASGDDEDLSELDAELAVAEGAGEAASAEPADGGSPLAAPAAPRPRAVAVDHTERLREMTLDELRELCRKILRRCV